MMFASKDQIKVWCKLAGAASQHQAIRYVWNLNEMSRHRIQQLWQNGQHFCTGHRFKKPKLICAFGIFVMYTHSVFTDESDRRCGFSSVLCEGIGQVNKELWFICMLPSRKSFYQINVLTLGKIHKCSYYNYTESVSNFAISTHTQTINAETLPACLATTCCVKSLQWNWMDLSLIILGQ